MANNKKYSKTDLFESVPVKDAVLTLAVPTVISQLVVLIYNMADTWYVGQTGDPAQVAAVTVAFPVMMVLNALANLFSIGGGSLLSRLLGAGKKERTGAVAGFMVWATIALSAVYALLVWLLQGEILTLLGAEEEIRTYAGQYLFWTVIAGGIPTALNLTLASIVRAQGDAKISSIGMSIGGVLNVILDPIFIFPLGMNVAGAALATGLSNTAGMLFLIFYLVRNRKNSLIPIHLRASFLHKDERKELFSIGMPAALTVILASVSNSFMVRLMSGYSVEAVSGMGIMQKLDIIPFQVIMGVSDGALPLIAYNYASKNKERMNGAIRFAIKLGFTMALVFFALFELAAPLLVRFFISDAETIAYGTQFVRLRCTALPFITVEFMLIAVFQAVGGAKQALILSLFRKGIFDLPLMMLMNHLWPMYGLMLVQPTMEFAGAAIALILYHSFAKTQDQLTFVQKTNAQLSNGIS